MHLFGCQNKSTCFQKFKSFKCFLCASVAIHTSPTQELAAKRLVCIIYVLYVMYTCLFEPMWGMHTTCVHSVVDESMILYAIIIMEEVLP